MAVSGFRFSLVFRLFIFISSSHKTHFARIRIRLKTRTVSELLPKERGRTCSKNFAWGLLRKSRIHAALNHPVHTICPEHVTTATTLLRLFSFVCRRYYSRAAPTRPPPASTILMCAYICVYIIYTYKDIGLEVSQVSLRTISYGEKTLVRRKGQYYSIIRETD